MRGICNTCKYFKANVHREEEKPHHCNFQNIALSKYDSKQICDECIPKNKGCYH